MLCISDAYIAPKDIIELISCNCGGNCNDRRRRCVKNVVCTDFCGCGDTCENADHSPPGNINEDLEEEWHYQSVEDFHYFILCHMYNYMELLCFMQSLKAQ